MYKIVSIPGDGIGPEVVAGAVAVLEQLSKKHGFEILIEEHPFGNAAWKASGTLLPPGTEAAIDGADALLFGAIDSLDRAGIPPEERARGSLHALRGRLGLFASLRPLRTEPALAEVSPFKARVLQGVDLMMVRELSGGLYAGTPRGVEQLAYGQRRGVNTHVYTEDQIVRAARFAFALARGRRGRQWEWG
jgi:3-isopropylmalate dehydrogenase